MVLDYSKRALIGRQFNEVITLNSVFTLFNLSSLFKYETEALYIVYNNGRNRKKVIISVQWFKKLFKVL